MDINDSFIRIKIVWITISNSLMPCPSMWPKQFWSDQIDLDLTLMIWSRPKWNGQDQNELVRSKLWFSTKMNHIWTWPIHFGPDHFILVVTKSLRSSPNQFGQTKTILDWPKLFWSHRRIRHKTYLTDKVLMEPVINMSEAKAKWK